MSFPIETVKRCLDVTCAAGGLAAAFPLLAVTAVAVRLRLGAPVLFRQRRAGRAGRLFTLYKFRTMAEARGEDGQLLPDAERITRLGRWLRRTSIDELPQLWNVLKGDMSLVGPRPLLAEYLSRYDDFQRRRLEVKPGITGWAQIHGRNGISWEERFALDVWYVDHRSLGLDVKILWKTLWIALAGSGVSQRDHVTMHEFTGGPGIEGSTGARASRRT